MALQAHPSYGIELIFCVTQIRGRFIYREYPIPPFAILRRRCDICLATKWVNRIITIGIHAFFLVVALPYSASFAEFHVRLPGISFSSAPNRRCVSLLYKYVACVAGFSFFRALGLC